MVRRLSFMKKGRIPSEAYLSITSPEPAWERLLMCSLQKVFSPQQETLNGLGPLWINSWQIKSMSPSLAWRHTWMLNSKGIAGVMWIMARPDIQERRSDIGHLLSKQDETIQILFFLIYLQKKGEWDHDRERSR